MYQELLQELEDLREIVRRTMLVLENGELDNDAKIDHLNTIYYEGE